jgi:hypothetical protein
VTVEVLLTDAQVDGWLARNARGPDAIDEGA